MQKDIVGFDIGSTNFQTILYLVPSPNLVFRKEFERYRRCLWQCFIPVTRGVKGYTTFVGKYVTGRRNRFRPHKVYLFLIRITSRVRLSV